MFAVRDRARARSPARSQPRPSTWRYQLDHQGVGLVWPASTGGRATRVLTRRRSIRGCSAAGGDRRRYGVAVAKSCRPARSRARSGPRRACRRLARAVDDRPRARLPPGGCLPRADAIAAGGRRPSGRVRSGRRPGQRRRFLRLLGQKWLLGAGARRAVVAPGTSSGCGGVSGYLTRAGAGGRVQVDDRRRSTADPSTL